MLECCSDLPSTLDMKIWREIFWYHFSICSYLTRFSPSVFCARQFTWKTIRTPHVIALKCEPTYFQLSAQILHRPSCTLNPTAWLRTKHFYFYNISVSGSDWAILGDKVRITFMKRLDSDVIHYCQKTIKLMAMKLWCERGIAGTVSWSNYLLSKSQTEILSYYQMKKMLIIKGWAHVLHWDFLQDWFQFFCDAQRNRRWLWQYKTIPEFKCSPHMISSKMKHNTMFSCFLYCGLDVNKNMTGI